MKIWKQLATAKKNEKFTRFEFKKKEKKKIKSASTIHAGWFRYFNFLLCLYKLDRGQS